MFKPTVHECQVAEGDEVLTFHVREPSGREMLGLASNQKKDQPAITSTRDLFSRYIVNEDGSAITKERVEEFLDMRLTAMRKMIEIVQEKIGIKDIGEKKS